MNGGQGGLGTGISCLLARYTATTRSAGVTKPSNIRRPDPVIADTTARMMSSTRDAKVNAGSRLATDCY